MDPEPVYYRKNRTSETNIASQTVDPGTLSYLIQGANATRERADIA